MKKARHRNTEKVKKHRFRNIIINLLLVLMLLVGLALVFNNQIKYYLMGLNANQYHISKVTDNTVKANNETEGNFDFSSVEPLSTEAVVEAQVANQDLPVIGGITIPAINLNLPIFKGLDNTNLLWGAGTMKVDQKMGEGNYALASHYVAGQPKMLFSPLKEGPAQAGQKVYLTDKSTIYEYQISEVYEVSPEHGEVIDDLENQRVLTLVTCSDANATNRIIVRANFEKSYSVGEASQSVTSAFEQKYNQMTW
ncbi:MULTISPECIES: class A sortase [unclassified Enterococcus]|uniref:class A sortase n=1 Tax=unclassified Enterococcus TaxID=2608891 RepID=UPI001552B23D|nr:MULTISPECIES: class A sortase [unclassified Enterococcus]MBS7577887.1 class A sortase [Enterococcus sp. MMGLQ5-2]MBS7585147.1 class A sortase [Enterococcus sp. MMGLQ5-1]NPD13003.1 class A sortase [Enterococcus sp. MMGLQ5-1]NPD37717.1 class A sortase [Enterococcus sp. MMGLQ5-2]